VNRDFQRGRVSIGAPLVNPNSGQPVGGLSVATLDEHISPSAVPELANDVREAAVHVSARLRA
jgi:DNA-binding IclR family transcriptional regulator